VKKLVYIILCLQVFILSALGEGRMELPAKRTFNSKTFLNQDGTYTTEISSGYLHYMDTDSTYAEIDHNFRKTHRSGYDYEVTRGLYRVYAKSDVSDSASLVVETSDGLSLAMGLWGVAYLDVSSKDYKVLQRTRSTSGVVEGNRLSFPAAFKGVEVRYSYLDTRLKEEILISQAARERLPDPAQYGFARKNTYLVFITELETDRDRIRSYVSAGFDSTGEDYETEGRIDFKTLRGELKFFFPVDRAYLESGEENMDSAFETAVRKRLISRNNKRYLLAGVPLSWLKGLPAGTVIIDPTVSLYPTHDAYLRSGTPGSNYGSSSEVQVGNGSPGRLRSLFKFDLSAIPSTARLVSSEFKLYYFSWLGNYPPTLRVLTCHQMLKDWNESSVSWSYQNLGGSIPWNTPGVGRDNVDAKSTAEYGVGVYATYGWISFNLKNLTGRWLNGDPNYGILLVDLYENTYGDYKRFRSSEASSNKPVLSVTYQLLKNFFYIKDHLGNIRVTLDEQGSVVGYDDYYPFGMQMGGRSYNQGLEDNIYKYSSKELDEEQLTGGKLDWYYFGARYYDPDIGRWLRVDPMADKFPDITPYHYTHNNPLNKIDPDGRRDDWNTFISKKEIHNASTHNISISNTKQELVAFTEVAPQGLDIMSATCNVLVPFSGPLAPTFLGMGLFFKGSSTALKVTNQIITYNNNTTDIVGDGVGIIVGITHPIAGEIADKITDFTLDNMNSNLTTEKVDETKKIHQENRIREILQEEISKNQNKDENKK